MPPDVPSPVICLVTNGGARRADDEVANGLVASAARAANAGVNILQIRERRLPDRDLLTFARRVIAAVDRSRMAIVVNDRTDVALASGAAGVHLRADSMRASRVRAVAPDRFLIGRSVHSLEEAREAEEDGGADYLIFGTVFPTAAKPDSHPVAGLDALAAVCATVRLPVVAIGGLNAARAADVAAAGAAGVAGIGMFVEADRQGAPALSELVRRAREPFGSAD